MASQDELPMPALELPAAFVERWRALDGEPIEVRECVRAAGRWWIVVRLRGRDWGVLHRGDPAEAATDLHALSRPQKKQVAKATEGA